MPSLGLGNIKSYFLLSIFAEQHIVPLLVLAETTVYGKVGGEVDLRPDARSVTNTIKSVLWKAGPDIAMEWEGMEIVSHRHFKGRCYLNTSTGVMTITQLTPNDSGVYTPEINDVLSTPINLIIISAVPVPTVLTSCDEEMTRCTLTCDGQTTEAEEVTYRWKSDDTIVMDAIKKEYVIVKVLLTRCDTCDLENVVSSESSQPISNPFNTGDSPHVFNGLTYEHQLKSHLLFTAPEEPLKVSTGLTVFISLLAAVLLLGIFHRLKAGEDSGHFQC
uniref:Ig-like domain-containing protein n=1 Tax=Amphiprion ocellaris TaxID=80972 RepID=A0AAQ5YAE7_AMPOC